MWPFKNDTSSAEKFGAEDQEEQSIADFLSPEDAYLRDVYARRFIGSITPAMSGGLLGSYSVPTGSCQALKSTMSRLRISEEEAIKALTLYDKAKRRVCLDDNE